MFFAKRHTFFVLAWSHCQDMHFQGTSTIRCAYTVYHFHKTIYAKNELKWHQIKLAKVAIFLAFMLCFPLKKLHKFLFTCETFNCKMFSAFRFIRKVFKKWINYTTSVTLWYLSGGITSCKYFFNDSFELHGYLNLYSFF